MLKGIYSAASGMIPQVKKQEIAANNIANAATTGFKKDNVFLKNLSEAKQGLAQKRSEWERPMLDQVYTDFSQGTFTNTSERLDMAIKGDGFFVLESPTGEERVYTRNGNFSIDSEGYLSNKDGYRVLSDAGPIAVNSSDVEISSNGDVIVDSTPVSKIQVADFEDYSQLEKTSSTSFTVPEGVEPVSSNDYELQQGYLEQANINIIKEMVNMIITMRNYESNAKALQAQDESLSTLFSKVGQTQM